MKKYLTTKKRQEKDDDEDEREDRSPSKKSKTAKKKEHNEEMDGDVIMTQITGGAGDDNAEGSQNEDLNEELKKVKVTSKQKSKKEADDDDFKEEKVVKPKKKSKICNVCFQLAGTPIEDQGYDIMECDKCKLPVHRRCVGESVPFKEIKPTKGLPFKYFECQRCSHEKVKNAKKLICIVCSQPNGIMTQIEEDSYSHIICALMCDYFEIIDFGLMKFKQTVPTEEIEKQFKAKNSKKTVECHFCHSSNGFMLKCLKRNCKQSAHAFCIQNDRKTLLMNKEKCDDGADAMIVDDEGIGWEVEFRLQDYTQQPCYSAELDVHRTIREPRFFFNDIQLHMVTEKQSQAGEGKVRRSKATSGLPKKESKGCDLLTKQGNKLHSKVNLPMRGGKISVVCNDHRSELKICFCDGNSKSELKNLLQCNYCKMWYHCGCVKMGKQEARDADVYSCQKCTKWALNRQKVILPAILNNQSNTGVLFPQEYQNLFCNWNGWQNEILPQERYRLKLLDTLIIGRIWCLQSQQLSTYSTTSEIVKQQLIRAQFIPLNLCTSVNLINDKISKVLEYEASIEDDVFNRYSLADIKEVLSSDGMRQEENIADNVKISAKLRDVIDEEEKVHKLKSLRCEDLEMLMEMIQCNLELCDVSAKSDKKITLAKLKHIKICYDKAQEQYQFKSEMKSFLDMLFKQGIAFQSNIDKVLCEQPLDSELLADIIKSFESKKPIEWVKTNIIEEATKLKIDFSDSISIIEKEISLSEQWQPSQNSIQEWMESIKALITLKIRSPSIDQAITAFKENENWILAALDLLDSAKSKTNTLEQLDKQLKDISSKKNPLAIKVAFQLKTLKDDIMRITSDYTKDLKKDKLSEIVTKAKQLTVRPNPDSYKQMTFHLKVLLWLDQELTKPLSIELLQSKLQSLNPYLIPLIEKKLKEAMEVIDEKITPFFDTIKNDCSTIQDVSNEVFHLDRAIKLLSYNFQLKTSKVPDYTKLTDWLSKIDGQLLKHKCKLNGKTIREQCEIIRKDEIPKIIVLYQPEFEKLCSLSRTYYDALCDIRDSYCDPLVSSFLGKGKISLAKLLKLQSKYQQSKEKSARADDVNKQIEAVKIWQADFKQSLPAFQSELKKELKSNPKKILDNASRIMENQRKMRLELEVNEQRLLDKCRKWAQLTIDCNILIKDRKQTEIPFDRIYDIKNEVGKIKCLDKDIESISQVRNEFEKIEKWHQDLDKVMMFNQDGQLIKADRGLMKQLIQFARTQIKINIEEEILELDQQLLDNEEWETKCQALFTSQDYHKVSEALDLLKLVKNDKDHNYALLEKPDIQKLKIWCVQGLSRKNTETKQQSFAEFSKSIERNLQLIEECSEDVALIEDMKMIAMAYRLQSKPVPQTKKKQAATNPSKKIQPRTITQEDCEMILNNPQKLPFSVESKLLKTLKKDHEKYMSELKSEAENLIASKPLVCEFDDTMTKLEELSFVSPCEELILKNKRYYSFIMQCVKDYPEVKPRAVCTPVKRAPKSDSDEAPVEMEEKPRFFSDFQKIAKKYKKLQCQCPEGLRLAKEFEDAKTEFGMLKSDFAKLKLAQSFTFNNIGFINEKLMCLSLDFEDEELMFRQEIWHQRIALLISELNKKASTYDHNRINCEQIRLWLEEGQELEVVNDQKYEKLSEIVEDIDNIARALRLCSSPEEVTLLDEQENRGLIDISHLVTAAKDKVSETSKSSGGQPKLLAKGVIEYLRSLRDKGHKDKDVEMREDDESLNGDEFESEEDGDTDLEDEKDDEGPAPEEAKSKKKKLSIKPVKEASKPIIGTKNKFSKKEPSEKPTIVKKRDKKVSEKKEDGAALTSLKDKIVAKKMVLKKKAPEEIDGTKAPAEKPVIKGMMGGGIKKIGGGLKTKPAPKAKSNEGEENAEMADVETKEETVAKPSIFKKKAKPVVEKKESPAKPKATAPVKPILSKVGKPALKLASKSKDNEADTADCSQDPDSSTKHQKSTKEEAQAKEEVKPSAISNSLLKKRPLMKSTIGQTKDPIVKPGSKIEEPKEQVVKPAAAKPQFGNSLIKKPLATSGIVKKIGGGGLAASLAKIKN